MKPKPDKSHDGYCAFDPEGKVLPNTYSLSAGCAENILTIIKVHKPKFYKTEMKRLRKEGYTVRKVKIIEVK